jgi:hypothetical protein
VVNPKQLREQRPRIPNPRVARGATQTRVKHNARARYAAIVRFSLVLSLASVLLIAYVVMTSRLTGLTYALGKEQAQRADLQEQTARLDDSLAALDSQDRLARVAVKLGMREPQEFAQVTLPATQAPATRDSRLAFLAPLDTFFGGRFAPHSGVR